MKFFIWLISLHCALFALGVGVGNLYMYGLHEETKYLVQGCLFTGLNTVSISILVILNPWRHP